MNKLLLLIVIFVFSSCIFTEHKENRTQSHTYSIDTISLIDMKKEIPERDSIDTLIELRRLQCYDGNLFAKMKFGDSRSICKQKLNIYDEHFKHRIYIPKDSTFRFFDIGEIRPSYYKNQLYKLEIFFDGYGTFDDLEKMFTSKYGKTKDGIWKYRNAEISVDCESRTPVVYPYGNSNVYYGGYRVRNGGPGSSVTKESSYYVISYLNYNLQELLQKEEALKDSLNEVKRLKEFQEEIKKVDNQQEFI